MSRGIGAAVPLRRGWYQAGVVSVSTGLCHELAALARLSLTAEEADLFASQLDPVLSYLQQLQSVDVSEIDPTPDAAAALRADEPGPAFDIDAALAGAPAMRSGHVVVPKFKQD